LAIFLWDYSPTRKFWVINVSDEEVDYFDSGDRNIIFEIEMIENYLLKKLNMIQNLKYRKLVNFVGRLRIPVSEIDNGLYGRTVHPMRLKILTLD
jgi:hypothetical protein